MKKLYYFFIACFIACKPELTEKENSNFTTKPQISTVFITGISDENGFNKTINFYNDSVFYKGKPKQVSKIFKEDSVKITINKLEKPTLLEIMAFGKDSFYRTRIISSPGDSISYKLKEGKLEFTGNNKENYNFYLEMDRNYNAWSKLYLDKYNPDFKKYKQQCDSLYNKRLTFFNDYVKKNPTVSEEFKMIIKDDLRFEYLVNLIKPRSEIESNCTVNTQEDLFTIYQRGYNKEGEFFNLNGYLNNITLEEINKPEYVNYLYFQMSIVPLLRQYFVQSSEIPFSIASFKEELTFLKQNFNQTIIDRATARLIIDYFKRGFGKDNNTSEFMKNTIKKYKESVNDPNIISSMEDIEAELNTINKILPKDFNELVLNLSKDTVSFGAVFQKKNIKVIDFWASWCIPCIQEIMISKEKREQIVSEYNVDFIYLSIDKDNQKWIDKSISLSQFLKDEPQYKILNQKKSSLIKYLNLRSSIGFAIPRYVILDENNKIIDNNAPKISEDKFEDIISNIF